MLYTYLHNIKGITLYRLRFYQLLHYLSFIFHVNYRYRYFRVFFLKKIFYTIIFLKLKKNI